MHKQTVKIIYHIIAWAAFIFMPFVFFRVMPPPQPDSPDPLYIPSVIVSSILLMAYFYLNYFVFFPDMYLKKRRFVFLICTISSFWVIFWVSFVILNSFEQEPASAPLIPFPVLFASILRFLIVLFFSCGLAIYEGWRLSMEGKLKAEVAYLKAQINPHFLFNTLNSIYVLSIKKSDNTPDAIVKLSNMMRYLMSETGNETVSLKMELNYINSYIELQKLRLTPKIEIEIEISEDVPDLKIAPMLLIPFIENAFKYGVNMEDDCFLRIKIEVWGSELQLIVENKKVKTQFMNNENSGLGIVNTKQRLSLLYPGKHELAIDDSSEKYTVNLKMKLK